MQLLLRKEGEKLNVYGINKKETREILYNMETRTEKDIEITCYSMFVISLFGTAETTYRPSILPTPGN